MIDRSVIVISYKGELVEIPLIAAKLILAPICALYQSSRSGDKFAIQALDALFKNVMHGRAVFPGSTHDHAGSILGTLGFATREPTGEEGLWIYSIEPHVASVVYALSQTIGYTDYVYEVPFEKLGQFFARYEYQDKDLSMVGFILDDLTKQLPA
jgi:hypothetical protein